MQKVLNLSKPVHDLVKEYPELISILADLGFTEITKKAALNTVGRFMTLPKGAVVKGIDLSKVLSRLQEEGFTLSGGAGAASARPPRRPRIHAATPEEEERRKLLSSYVKRLSDGEDLESVRADFVKHFKDVDAGEIAIAEQTLMGSGVPLRDVQRLCDVHSALFHGATRSEKIAAAEAQVQASLGRGSAAAVKREDGADALYGKLKAIPGHPLRLLTLENEAIAKALKTLRGALLDGADILPALERVRQVQLHYIKKNVLYPILKLDYGFSGPSDVMWSVDDEIRDSLSALARAAAADEGKTRDGEWRDKLSQALTRGEEMIYKENNILFPLCAKNFSEDDWKGVAKDFSHMEPCLIPAQPLWEEAAQAPAAGMLADGEIHFPTGTLTLAQLTALLDTLPLELTFVDAGDVNRYWNDDGKPKLFSRPASALGREVYSCHPPKVVPMVRQLIGLFREGKKDSVDVWMEKQGEPVLVRYMAVRDKGGNYLGTLEMVQRMGFAKEHFGK